MKSWNLTIQMKATEQYLPVVLFIMLYKVVLTFESVHEILKHNHSNANCWAVLSCGTFIMLCKVVLPFESLDKIVCYDLLMKAFEQYFAVVLFIMF